MNGTAPPSGPAPGAGTATHAGAGPASADEIRATGVTDTELVYDDTPAPPGRPVRLVPTSSGFWRLVLGALGALLAPFFGILVGSTIGTHDTASGMDPLYWGFFIGGLIGIVGIMVGGSGALTLMRHLRSREPEAES